MIAPSLTFVTLFAIVLEIAGGTSKLGHHRHHKNALTGNQRTLKSNDYSYFAFLSYEARRKSIGGPCTCIVLEQNIVLAYGSCYNNIQVSYKDRRRYFVQLNEDEIIKYYATRYQFTEDDAFVLLGTTGMPPVQNVTWFTGDLPTSFDSDELNFYAEQQSPSNDTTLLQGQTIVKLPVKNCSIGINDDFLCQTNGKVGDYCQYGGPLLYQEKVLGIFAQQKYHTSLTSFPGDNCQPGDVHEFLDIRRYSKEIQDALVKIKSY